MGLVKSIKVILGVIGSGSMLLALSGSAFAADGGVGTTPLASVDPVLQINESGSTTVDNTKSVNLVVMNADGSGGGQPNPSGGASLGAGTGTQVAGAAKTLIVGVAKSDTPAGLLTTLPRPDLTAGSSVTTDIPGAQGVVSAPAGNLAVTGKTDGPAQVAPMSQAVMFYSTRLAIQPKITNMNIQTSDLASMIPSAPAQRQNPTIPPTPITPTGLFTSFAAQLAASVVPSVFSVTNWGFPALATLISVLAAILYLAVGRAVSVFGPWTRRGGFAHAARSDVPSVIINTFFATPHRLGYVLAFAPLDSPFLMVSETKTVLTMVPNAFRKEEMR